MFRKKREEKKKAEPRVKKKPSFPKDKPFGLEEMIFYDEIVDDA